MTAPASILDLVERFDRDKAYYKSNLYNETQARQEFIDPLFEALGWDIGNRQGAAAASRDVVLEYSMKIGATTKAPDYLFRLGGANRFFVEAKKPSVDLREGVAPAYQVRRYAWTAGLPLSILTDFEELAIYDCRVEPDKIDKASVAHYRFYPYDAYANTWDEIAELFHRDAVLGGSLEKFAQEQKAPKGALGVDKAFLADIDGWRALLAKNIAIWNPELSQRELNYAVQMTLDRLIFLRIGEDRGIEPYGKLQGLLTGGEVYKRLINQFRDADDRYNSGLFHFKDERGREGSDSLTPNLYVDDEPLKKILKGLYYPDSPYEFSVLPVEVLGNVYEQFLGKVITVGADRKVEVEEKPEVRKAGGVYYTPAYIVDYIVKHTVGTLLEGKTPAEAAKLRILDPACGSGSFLIGAYQYLLNWHLSQYVADGSAKHKKELYKGTGDDWRLTTGERKRILLNNIYGVDIDAQAVEVTKLSLSLKMLEGETEQTLGTTRQMFQERVLPDLSNNIKCGNSLIGSDFYDGPQAAQLTDEEQYRINAFDWEAEFPTVMPAGGFDAVIGNPPYVRSINLKESNPVLWNLYRSRYRSASEKEWDIYLIFVEKALELLSNNGKLGYILPNKFLNSQVGEQLRAVLSEGQHLERLVHFGAFQIFQNATTYTCLLFLNRSGNNQIEVARYVGPVNKAGAVCPLPEGAPKLWQISEVPATKLTADVWTFRASGGNLLEKLQQWPGLGSVAQIFQGTGTRADKVYLVEERGYDGDLIRIYSVEKDAEYLLEPHYLKPALRGRSIGRYEEVGKDLLLIVPYEIINGKSVLVPPQKLRSLAPRTLEYLYECKSRLDERENGRFKDQEGWYAYGYPRSMTKFDTIKIAMPDVCNRGKCWLEEMSHWLIDTAYGVMPTSDGTDLKYLLGILNSPLLTYFLKETGTALRGGYFRMKTAYLNPFPIRTINFSDPADKKRHDDMVVLVERMLDLHKRLPAVKTSQEKTVLQRQIDGTDKQIDKLVYELYALTGEEIAIVEGATK